MVTINSTVHSIQIDAQVNNITIAVTLGSAVSPGSAAYVSAGTPFRLNGQSGNTYLVYNTTTSRLELYVNGSIVQEFS